MLAARLISFISNPIFILIGLPYLLVVRTTDNASTALVWSIYTWGFLAVFVLFVLWGVRKKIFNDIDVSDRKKRPLLYLFGAVLAIVYTLTIYVLHGPPILFISIIGILLAIFLGSLVNLKIKASVHAASITALITGLIAVYGGYFWFLLLLIPAICWSRVKIKRHSIREVIAGVILGSLISLLMLYITNTYYIL